MVYNSIVIILLGIIEGITEWLPVSSTGHMLLFDEFLPIRMSKQFKDAFFILVQLAAVIAVAVEKRKDIIPVTLCDRKLKMRKDVMSMWLKVCVSCIPGVCAVLLFGSVVDKYLDTPLVIGIALLFYGVVFIILEKLRKPCAVKVTSIEELSYKRAFVIGLFQSLSIVPGTSRSGATIAGAITVGVDRQTASAFTFFMAIPVMFGMSVLELFKLNFAFSAVEISALALGMAVSFVISLFAIRFLTEFVKKHTFLPFGVYRIILGVAIILYFYIK